MTSPYGHAHTHPAVKENHDAGHNIKLRETSSFAFLSIILDDPWMVKQNK